MGGFRISAFWEIGLVGLFALPGATVLVWRMVERSWAQLAFVADVDHLRAMLTLMQARSGAGAPVVVPAALMERVADIENAHIARERAHAVVASVRTVDRGYGLVLAQDVTAQKAALDRDERLAVEELIDQVLAEPQAPANPDDDGLRCASTPDGLTEIDYRVDEPTQRVHVVDLRVARAAVRADY